jgi:hypothetical protein
VVTVVDEGMLAGERKSGWTYTALLEDLAVVVELAKIVIEGVE